MISLETIQKMSQVAKKRWRDPNYRRRMKAIARNKKRCKDCKYLYTKRGFIYLNCRKKSSLVLTGGEFACKNKFKAKEG